MKTNKSIDGLTTRVSKKSSKISSVPREKVKSSMVASKKTNSNLNRTSSLQSNTKTKAKKPVPVVGGVVVKTKKTAPISSNALTKQLKTSSKIQKTKKTSTVSSVEDFLSPVKAFDLNESLKDGKKSDNVKDTENKKADSKHRKFANVKVGKLFRRNKLSKKKKEKKKPSKVRRIITACLLIMILVLIAGAVWVAFWGNDIITKITGGQGSVFDLFTLTTETYNPLKVDSNGRTNILAFGTSGYNMDGDEGNGHHDGAQLTDSIMMISINQDTGDIVMSSLPRDLKASPTCTATGKINEVYWCHGGGGNDSIEQETAAANALMSEVGSILGVDFQYYVHINWGSLVQIVDTLGGIKVTLDEDILDYYWTGAVYEAGVQYTLNGEQALGLARARHGTAAGDFSRGTSQQKILIGIKDRLLEKELSIADFMSLASALGDNLRTNFSISELKTIAHYVGIFDFDSMRQISLYPDCMTTGNINGISYVVPRAGVGNYGAIQAYVAEKLSNDPRTYESPSILILNATGKAGLASAERERLIRDGYKNIDIDDISDGLFTDEYTLYYTGVGAPGTNDLLEKYYWFDSLPISELPDSVPRDYTFVIVIGPTDTSDLEDGETI